MCLRRVGLIAVIVLAMTAVYADEPGPANVFQGDDACTIGWLGCDPSVAIPRDDGSLDCPLSGIQIVGITGNRTTVDSNGVPDVRFSHCTTRIEFGQVNPIGLFGADGYAVAAHRDAICLLFPKTCRGNGAVVINFEAVGAVGSCTLFGETTFNYQSQITPSGQASLACFLSPSE